MERGGGVMENEKSWWSYDLAVACVAFIRNE